MLYFESHKDNNDDPAIRVDINVGVTYSIGRFNNCAIKFPRDCVLVSRLHATFQAVEKYGQTLELTLRNQSAHGTLVNGEAITDSAVIRPDDVVTVGPKSYVLRQQLSPSVIAFRRMFEDTAGNSPRYPSDSGRIPKRPLEDCNRNDVVNDSAPPATKVPKSEVMSCVEEVVAVDYRPEPQQLLPYSDGWKSKAAMNALSEEQLLAIADSEEVEQEDVKQQRATHVCETVKLTAGVLAFDVKPNISVQRTGIPNYKRFRKANQGSALLPPSAVSIIGLSDMIDCRNIDDAGNIIPSQSVLDSQRQ